MVLDSGFSENMSKFSYFSSGVVDDNRMELYDDGNVIEMIRISHEIESMNLYVVREDDLVLDDVLVGEVEEEEEPQDDDEAYDFYRHDYMESDGSEGEGDNDRIDFYVGQEFVSKEKCKATIEKYVVRKKLNIHFPKCEKKKIQAVCVQDSCKWRLYASINSRSDKMVVRTMEGTHSCYPTGVVDLYSAPKIAADYINEFRTNPKLSAEQIQQRLGMAGLRVTKTKCQSARQIMKHIVSDEYAEQFTRMYDYVEKLRKTNLGSTVILGTKDRVFEKFYTCFASHKNGWKSACRRVIHLDGTFLKSRMKGQLLTAVGKDPNDAMYIIGWAIVPVENKVYWEWFMDLLREDLGLEDGNGVALSSDQQKGLIYAIKNVLPDAEHRMCARHIFANLQKRAFFSDIPKSVSVENNISESYNAVLKDAREKPIVGLLEDIRRHIMASNLVKIKEMESVTSLVTPKALATIEKQKKSLKWCQPLSNGRGIYEVDHGKNKYVVHVRDKTSCSCREYDVSGIPCCHIMCALWAEYKETKLPETVVLDWFSVEKWKLCYSSLMFPVNGMELWETHSDVVVMPPLDRIMSGRPKNNDRVRDPSEAASQTSQNSQKAIVTCSNCLQTGHNIWTCEQEIVPKPPKPVPLFPSFHAKTVMTCSNCQQTGHNKRKCRLEPVTKPSNQPRGRPSKKQKTIEDTNVE
ncbi:uncharacterized protein LOC103841103 [Brassica rapa]|uniref:uncharacterized protein LOC103841103 n=1 Tax=Brassica campestris TaxID=3711 RepID=UPI0004F14F16|nr:uncharacterized protein LOC103841103 [Brassica rapa]